MKTRNLMLIIIGGILAAGIVAAAVLLVRGELMVLRSPMVTKGPSIITWMEGDVTYLPGDTDSWVTAEVGARLREGDAVRTGPGGTVDIRLYDEGLVRLQSETQILLADLTLKNQTVDILNGTLFARVRLLFESQQLQFRTDNAVASVRGTELIFHVDDSGTRIDALSGITEVINPEFPEQRILLAYQKSTDVLPGTPPSDPVDVPPSRVAADRQVFNGMNADEVFLISHQINFEPNTANILPESVPVLDEVAKKLTLRREKILIVGHTADVGADPGQIRLSEKRAEAIRLELMERGISGRRLTTVGYGGSRPVGDNASFEGRAANRRVEFLVVE